MPRRPRVNVKRISKTAVKSYGYVRPNPGVRAIAAINGTGSYRKRKSARSEMNGLSASERRAKAKRTVRNATKKRSSSMPKRRIIRRNAYNRPRDYAGRRMVSFTVPKARGRGKRRVTFRAPRGVSSGETVTVMAKNRRRRVSRRRAPVRRRVVVRNKRRAPVRRRRVVRNKRKSPVRRRKVAAKRRAPARRRRIVRNKRKSPVRRRKVAAKRRSPVRRRRRIVRNKRRSPVRRSRRVVRNKRRSPVRRRKTAAKRRSPVRRRAASMRRNRRRSYRRNKRGPLAKLFKRNGIGDWLRSGGMIAAGVIGHKFFSGFLKNILVANKHTAESVPEVDAQADGTAPVSGLGFLPASLVPYANTISGGIAAAAGVYLVTKTVKDAKSRQLIAGGMVASFLHSLIVDLLKRNAPGFAQQISGLGASDANAARLSAMYGMGASIEPMYSPIGEYFSSGVSGLGALPSYEAQAGMGEYFSSVGEYFSSGVNGLGEYGSNPDLMQAAAGYGTLETSNTNHIDPSSNLDRELSIAEAAAGVGSMGPMQAAAGLGNVGTVGASQTWIPGESDPQIWAGTRPVDRSQMATAMIPAGSLQSGGGQGIFG